MVPGCLSLISCLACPPIPLSLPHSISSWLQEEEVNEVPEDSLDERYLTRSSCHDSHQTSSSNAFVCDVQEASSALDVASE